MKKNIKNMIDLAAGRKKIELVLKNCKVVNVFSNEVIEGDIAIDKGVIIGVGRYTGETEIDIEGQYISPGLVDGHVHIESTMVTPNQFARAVVPRGTTTIITDPHEIANVCGVKGIEFMINNSKELPLDVFFMLPSCVPATPFENSGAVLEADDYKELITNNRVLGLGELMNYPGVIEGNIKIIDKLLLAQRHGKIVDGHGPEISDKDLNAYVIAGVKTDHECSSIEEMLDRLRRGMYVLIREGTAARNLEVLIKAVTPQNERRCMFCTDDKHPEGILKDGHIDNNVRLAIKNGIDPIAAIRMGSLNACECYGLKNRGAIAPGYIADLIVIDNLKAFNILKVFKKGKVVAENSKPLFDIETKLSSEVVGTVNAKEVTINDLKIKLNSDTANVMKLIPHSILTKKVVRKVNIDDGGIFTVNKDQDILKILVVERHKATGNIGFGLVENFKLKGGAIASTVANDSHNIVIIGDNDKDIYTAINEVIRIGGGITIVSNGEVLQTLELPIAGLISDKSMEEVRDKLGKMLEIAYVKLGVNKELDPFMTLAFLALPVIPEIKVTDKGLFDVTEFKFIDIGII
ncbi:adenine deaminase [Clostridium sediminicola]|uniref:adenine deaminase n=1 Tax=Clostridium sediminicola TaxID=3114879 RepID=UPI0031F1E16D